MATKNDYRIVTTDEERTYVSHRLFHVTREFADDLARLFAKYNADIFCVVQDGCGGGLLCDTSPDGDYETLYYVTADGRCFLVDHPDRMTNIHNREGKPAKLPPSAKPFPCPTSLLDLCRYLEKP